MKTEIYFGIAIRLIIICTIGMVATYIPDLLRDFFGDTHCGGNCRSEFINDGYNWGARHYWYFWMMLGLFVLGVINSIGWIINKTA